MQGLMRKVQKLGSSDIGYWIAAVIVASALTVTSFSFNVHSGVAPEYLSSNNNSATVFGCLFGDCNFDPLSYDPYCTISASPSTIAQGQNSTISWSSNIFSPYLGGPNQIVPVSGSTTTSPTQTTNYILYDNAGAYGGLRSFYYGLFGIPTPRAYCGVTLTVNPNPPPPPACALNASPASIQSGESSELSYVIPGSPTSASISPEVGEVTISPPSTYTAWPTTTTTYTLFVESAAGSSFCQRVVTVGQPQTPTLNLYATPNRVVQGTNTTLTWNTQYATSCTLRAPSGAIIGTGTQNPTPAPSVAVWQTSIFTLTCSTAQSTQVQKSVTVGVQPIYEEF